MLTSTQEKILIHVGYEWWMFRAMRENLQSLSQGYDPVRNAMFESLAIHGRALSEFFYKKRPKKKYPRASWRVCDLDHNLTLQRSMPQLVKTWPENVGTRVAHLTDGREVDFADWQVNSTMEMLGKRIEYMRRGLGDDFPVEWIGDNHVGSRLLTTTRTSANSPTGPNSPTGASSHGSG